jgi:hypothetical protein
MQVYELLSLDEKEIDIFLSNVYKPTKTKYVPIRKALIAWQKFVRAQEYDVQSEFGQDVDDMNDIGKEDDDFADLQSTKVFD